MSIVCATHFTSSSLDAVQVATELAKRTTQKLYLVSVMPAGSSPAVDSNTTSALMLEAAAAREKRIDVETKILHGKLEHQLATFCRDVSARLLVLGNTSHSMSPLFATPIDKISADVSVPMLVVKSRLPFKPWTSGEGPLKVLLAIDHSWSSGSTRNWLQQLAAFGPLDVLATHIWSPAGEALRQGLNTTPTDEQIETWAARLQQTTESGLQGLPANVKLQVQLEIGRGHIGRQLLEIAGRAQRDVLVMGTHPHGLLGRITSVTHEVLAEGAQSVALIPQHEVAPAPRASKAAAVEARH